MEDTLAINVALAMYTFAKAVELQDHLVDLKEAAMWILLIIFCNPNPLVSHLPHRELR